MPSAAEKSNWFLHGKSQFPKTRLFGTWTRFPTKAIFRGLLPLVSRSQGSGNWLQKESLQGRLLSEMTHRARFQKGTSIGVRWRYCR